MQIAQTFAQMGGLKKQRGKIDITSTLPLSFEITTLIYKRYENAFYILLIIPSLLSSRNLTIALISFPGGTCSLI